MICLTRSKLKAPCLDGKEQIGNKIKYSKVVPNCVPLKNTENLTKATSEELQEKG